MNSASFAMALHLHQPIGNFENVIERAYKNCYLPLIELFLKYPDIKITLHISGCLFDYFKDKHPTLLEKIGTMSKAGQIELMGGAYYEPILIAIPENDLLGQIEMMSKYLKSRFNKNPQGMWIPERVWRQVLINPLSKAGIKYCILDDTHLLKAGIPKENLYGYFLTTKGRDKIAVFASDKKLRYGIPFSKPDEIIGYFREVAGRKNNPLFIYGDDGEKFGEWPGTHKWVYEDGWLKNFFEELKRNSSWLKLVHFSDYLNSHSPLGNAQIPEASYDEMIEWSSGSWLNFLDKYPESNQMHKKMHYVSSKLNCALQSHKENSRLVPRVISFSNRHSVQCRPRPEGLILKGLGPEGVTSSIKDLSHEALEEAKRQLYMGECNCAYWHGVFGGLYLYHLRNAVYNHLIKADSIIDEVMHKKKWIEIKKFDFDCDNKDEIVMETNSFALYFDPGEGGVLKELDYRPLSLNLINTLSRRKEQYHQKILEIIDKHRDEADAVKTIHEDIKAVDPLIGRSLTYDRYPRYCLRDYFIDKGLDRASLLSGSFEELGNFSAGSYKAKVEKDKLILEYNSFVVQNNKVKLSKEISIKSDSRLQIVYDIEKSTSGDLDALLAVEFNITMPFLNSSRYCYSSGKKVLCGLDEQGAIASASRFGIVDAEKHLNIKFEFSNKTEEILFFPIKTVSQSERAYELNFQCSCILPIWELRFSKSKSYRLKIDMFLKTSKKLVLSE